MGTYLILGHELQQNLSRVLSRPLVTGIIIIIIILLTFATTFTLVFGFLCFRLPATSSGAAFLTATRCRLFLAFFFLDEFGVIAFGIRQMRAFLF